MSEGTQHSTAPLRVQVDFLYLDLTTCDRCIGTPRHPAPCHRQAAQAEGHVGSAGFAGQRGAHVVDSKGRFPVGGAQERVPGV